MQGVKRIAPIVLPSLETLRIELAQNSHHRYELDHTALSTYASAVALLDIAESLRYIAGRVEEVQ